MIVYKNKMRKKAFTLVELLVTISIIAIILTIAIFSFSNTREDARNNQRVSDIKQVQLALEKYYSNNGSYPNELTFGQALTDPGGKIYMASLPNNPTPRDDGDCANSEYNYSYNSNSNSYYLTFCISRDNNEISAGINHASPIGILNTNIVINSAIADGGTLRDKEYLEDSTNQMISMGIWDDLVGWWDDSLIKYREDSGSFYVQKSYDITNKGNDAVQETESSQPTLSSTGIEFSPPKRLQNSGVNARINNSPTATIQFWVYPTEFSTNRNYCIIINNEINTALSFMFLGSTGRFRSFFRSQSSDSVQSTTSDVEVTADINSWQLITVVADCVNKTLKIYKNENKVSETSSLSLGSNTFISSSYSNNIMGNATVDQSLVGKMTDTRLYKKALSETEITSIYNQTKSRYGL